MRLFQRPKNINRYQRPLLIVLLKHEGWQITIDGSLSLVWWLMCVTLSFLPLPSSQLLTTNQSFFLCKLTDLDVCRSWIGLKTLHSHSNIKNFTFLFSSRFYFFWLKIIIIFQGYRFIDTIHTNILSWKTKTMIHHSKLFCAFLCKKNKQRNRTHTHTPDVLSLFLLFLHSTLLTWQILLLKKFQANQYNDVSGYPNQWYWLWILIRWLWNYFQ